MFFLLRMRLTWRCRRLELAAAAARADAAVEPAGLEEGLKRGGEAAAHSAESLGLKSCCEVELQEQRC